MRSTYVATNAVANNASVARSAPIAAVAEETRPRSWELEKPVPLPVRDRTRPADDLDGARGILFAVIAGAMVWVAIGWGATTLIGRLLS